MRQFDHRRQGRAGLLVLAFSVLSGCGGGDTGAGSAASAVALEQRSVVSSGPAYRTVFGPRRYVRGKGAPVTETATFSYDKAAQSCVLVVHNGIAPDTKTAVHSAEIRLNGVIVIGPNRFTGRTQVIEQGVRLLPRNTLAVELRSKPGSTLTAEIRCAGDAAAAVWDRFDWDDGSTWQ